jgi:hypothetical protein
MSTTRHGHSRTACIDFDDTIAPWGALFKTPPPFLGVAEALRDLAATGWTIVCLTSRASPTWWHDAYPAHGFDDAEAFGQANIAHIAEYMERYGIPCDRITAEKVPAAVYIDDRAIRVVPGNLAGVIRLLMATGE